MVTRRAVRISRHKSVRFLFLASDEERSLQKKLDTRNELLARILDAAVCIQKLQDQLTRTKRDFRTRVGKCIEVGGGLFENLL
jgi:hypothetical protein